MIININGNNVNFDEVVDVFDSHGPYCKEVEVHGFKGKDEACRAVERSMALYKEKFAS